MGAACIKVTKYFLFLFNLLFFILGAVILGFGVWIIADKSSFVSVLQTSSSSLQVGAYVFISVGAITMLMGLMGCIGAVNEVRCLLGLYFVFLLLILIAQVTVGVLFYFNAGKLKQEVGSMVMDIMKNYKVNASSSHEESLQEAWDYVQAQVKCCGWASFYNWTDNSELMNATGSTYPCSCEKTGEEDNQHIVKKGFCQVSNSTLGTNRPEEWPVYPEGCMKKVQLWLEENLGILLGVCVGVAVIELLGLLLSICLCRHIHSEDYSKVPKY
ncbi:CD82 antigen [Mesocricetus auratus]|uniref:Tetraspanin n=1 Tax=Mesocricetus auratus TaxID=10036 RepID=A0A1U7QCS1_MESAU|nr:CD82 antigen [Mesocricetus auratus]XP_040601834.1 CD82 antigen [Mesocricetus auratus]